MFSKPAKSKYQPKQIESDSTVDISVTEEITDFLETFLTLYSSQQKKS